MVRKGSRGKWLTKGALKLLSYACVDSAAAGITAAVVPLTMINPIVGGIIVAGSAIVSMAVCDRVVDKYVEDKVDECVDKYHEKADPIIESIKIMNKGKEIFCEKGEQSAREFLKKSGYDENQIEVIIKDYKKKS
jgi:hypothetical protein